MIILIVLEVMVNIKNIMYVNYLIICKGLCVLFIVVFLCEGLYFYYVF